MTASLQPNRAAAEALSEPRTRSDAVLAHTPTGAAVLVLSNGTSALLNIPNRRASHFPQSAFGDYVGHHPADSAQAIAELEKLRAEGGDCLVIPETLAWWLEHCLRRSARISQTK